MNLRINANSLRVRISEDELNVLEEKGEVRARTVFPSGESIRYGVAIGSEKDVTFRGGVSDFVLSVPRERISMLRGEESPECHAQWKTAECTLDLFVEVDLFSRRNKTKGSGSSAG